VLQPKQPAPQQQQQQQHLQQHQQQQQQARMTWQQQQPFQGADRLGPGSNGPAVAALGKPLQRRAGFNLPRPMAPPAGTSAAAGELPLRAPGLQQEQQQQQQGAAGGGQGYCVPGPSAGGPVRRVEVTTSFSTAQQYVSTLTAALTEEVNLQLAEQAKTFYSIVAQVQSVAVTASAGTGQGSYQQGHQQQQQKGAYHQKQQQYAQGSRQQAGSDTGSRLQAACARAGLHYHPGASLTVYNNSSSNSYGGGRGGGGGWGRGKKRGRGQGGRGGGGDDADEDGDAPPRKASSMYLTLSGKLDRRQFRWEVLFRDSGCAGPYNTTP
jgi:hypothetical protein